MTPAPAFESAPLPDVVRAVLTVARRYRRLVALGVIAGASLLSLLAAFALRFDLQVPDNYLSAMPAMALVLIAFRVAVVAGFGLPAARWRYVGPYELVRLAGAAAASSVLLFIMFRLIIPRPGLPLTVTAIELALFIVLVGGGWVTYRLLFEYVRRRYEGRGVGDRARRVVIVGAGEAGHLLMAELERMPQAYSVAGFLDDDPLKRGTEIQGVPVLGGTAEAVGRLDGLRIDEVIIALPSAGPEVLRRVLANLEPMGLPFRVLPGIAAVLAGHASVSHLRPLRIEDLLGREPVSLEIPELAADLRGKTVLITGAAGSIGSELARHVAANRPGRVLLVDQAESDLYFVDLELREEHPDVPIRALVGDILDEVFVTGLFERERPDLVFHAAAYKHVPLMESNERTAVRNNVLGTWQVARLAGEHGLGRFVLISTDKAADPASMMGATKRAAEIVVQELQQRYPDTHYVAVRFGNVLGSHGSVIPLFQKQIAAGGPVTITHPEVSRFFMTIPEAVRLVLQAGLLPEARGRIAMLEMGNPVKIVDLARNLVRLSGLRPEVDIEFRFTGLRPGEKLHETLHGEGEILDPTRLASVSIVSAATPARDGGLAAGLENYHFRRAAMGAECMDWLSQAVLGMMRRHATLGEMARASGR